MLSPQEIRNVNLQTDAFRKYKTGDVNDCLDKVFAEYERLYAENIKLVNSLKILADKVEEYRTEEDKIKTALMSAQKMSDSIIREAKHKAELDIRAAEIRSEKLVEEAQVKAERMLRSAEQSIKSEEECLVTLKKEVAGFKNRLMDIYKEHITVISALPDDDEDEVVPEAAPSEELISEEPEVTAAEEVAGDISVPVQPEPMQEVQENIPVQTEAPPVYAAPVQSAPAEPPVIVAPPAQTVPDFPAHEPAQTPVPAPAADIPEAAAVPAQSLSDAFAQANSQIPVTEPILPPVVNVPPPVTAENTDTPAQGMSLPEIDSLLEDTSGQGKFDNLQFGEDFAFEQEPQKGLFKRKK